MVRTPKVFIVEDAPDARAALAALFDTQGLQVIGTASTEFDATDWLSNNEGAWDVAVIDLLLLDGSGFNVLRRFASSARRGKIIVSSGFVSEPVRERCLALGADAVFVKTDVAALVRYTSTQFPSP